jgi:hypothetical protein
MPRWNLPLVVLGLLVTACTSEPTTSPEVDAQFSRAGAEGPASVTGEIGPGALYEVSIPENWNGDLVLYAHGYRFREAPVALPNIDELRDGLLGLGFGVAYSSYSENG